MLKEGEGMKNIIIVVIDALRARNLGCYGYSMKTSPNIDKLAKEGVLFEDAYCCINTTDPSLTTMFSGKYPTSHGIINHGPKITEEEIREFNRKGIILLPEILKSRGYTTVAIDWLRRWHRRGYIQYGVINYKYPTFLFPFLRILFPFLRKRRSFKIRKPTEDARTISDQAINIIRKNRKKKFFLFIHYWDTHTCYNPPKGYVEKFRQKKDGEGQTIEEVLDKLGNPEWRSYIRRCVKGAQRTSEIIARYDGAIAFIDHEIGRLIDALEECGILEQTLIVLTSDHGESLTDHGIYFTHHGLYDETIHVPLIIRSDGLPKNKRIKGFVQHVDVVPTILDFLGIEVGVDFDGKSLVPLVNNEIKTLRSFVYVVEAHTQRKRAIRTYGYKYIHALSEEGAICRSCERVHGDTEELYDLNKDPGEVKNMVMEQTEKANALKKQLSDWIKHLENKKEKERIKKKIKKLKTIDKMRASRLGV